jgi:HPt (histidine-containing phosphotransfer) domain-containing protein
MNDHVGKPVDVVHLHAVLERWIGRKAAGVEVSAAERVEAGEGPDFDFEAAIRRMAHSRPLWEKLARRYLDSTPASREIAERLTAGDPSAAGRIAHTLKSVAGTLGLLALQRAASALERSLDAPVADGVSGLAALEIADETARRRIGQHLSGA